MSWLELTIPTNPQQWQHLEPALEDVNALSITLLDAQDQAILEPAPGETPLWQDIQVKALFLKEVDVRGLVAVLQDYVHQLSSDQITQCEIIDQDWTRVWMDQFQPMCFGSRLWIYPSTQEPPQTDALAIVRLDPGLAFGTGTHPTTALCLQWLDSQALEHKMVLDYGCGSGVLAIAALKLGAKQAIGVDNDPQALFASQDNAERNCVQNHLETHLPADLPPSCKTDIILANILSNTLIALAPQLAQHSHRHTKLALSGILKDQITDIIEAYAPFFSLTHQFEQDEWVCLVMESNPL